MKISEDKAKEYEALVAAKLDAMEFTYKNSELIKRDYFAKRMSAILDKYIELAESEDNPNYVVINKHLPAVLMRFCSQIDEGLFGLVGLRYGAGNPEFSEGYYEELSAKMLEELESFRKEYENETFYDYARNRIANILTTESNNENALKYPSLFFIASSDVFFAQEMSEIALEEREQIARQLIENRLKK